MDWMPIETAPKDNRKKLRYVLITDGLCVPDIAMWHREIPAYVDKYGSHRLARPEGWFCVSGGRSRILNPAHWQPLPEPPKELR